MQPVGLPCLSGDFWLNNRKKLFRRSNIHMKVL